MGKAICLDYGLLAACEEQGGLNGNQTRPTLLLHAKAILATSRAAPSVAGRRVVYLYIS